MLKCIVIVSYLANPQIMQITVYMYIVMASDSSSFLFRALCHCKPWLNNLFYFLGCWRKVCSSRKWSLESWGPSLYDGNNAFQYKLFLLNLIKFSKLNFWHIDNIFFYECFWWTISLLGWKRSKVPKCFRRHAFYLPWPWNHILLVVSLSILHFLCQKTQIW